MNVFDARIYAIRRRKNRHRPFEVRWRAAGQGKSRSVFTRGLADSYRAELVRAARQCLEFDPATGESALWAVPEPQATSWHQHACPGAARGAIRARLQPAAASREHGPGRRPCAGLVP